MLLSKEEPGFSPGCRGKGINKEGGTDLILKRPLLFIVVLAILANVAILFVDDFLLQFAFGLILLCLLPGFLFIHLLFSPSGLSDLLERIVLSSGVGYCFLVLGTLGIHYLPGPITPHLVLLIYDSIVLFLLILCFGRTGGKPDPLSQNVVLQIVLLVALASLFRLTYLGYSEFQGDEAKLMLRAAEIIRGGDDVLFLHKKGPVEILIPALFYSLSYRTNEFVARVPFALSSLIGLTALYLLGRRMFNQFSGFTAALLLAVEGYSVAFSRIVQYQSVVFMMMVLSIFCFYKFLRSDGDDYRYPVLGSLFAGVGLLAHYDAFFALPVNAYLFFRKAKDEGWGAREWVRLAMPPVIVLALVTFSFYLPFILHPHFQNTYTYITEGRIREGILYNNLTDFFMRSTFYNSTYYVLFMVFLVAGWVIGQLRAAFTKPPLTFLLPALFIAGLTSVSLFPSWWHVGKLDLAIFFFAAILLALFAFPQVSLELKASLLWFAGPSLVYFFMIGKVRTHYYGMFFPWALIVGTVIDNWRGSIWRISRARKAVLSAVGVFAVALMLVFACYIYMVFVRHDPEYKRTYPEHKNRFYWTVYSEIPREGYFGFPYRAGWKVIGYLYDQGILKGDYDSNEENLITTWYTRAELRCPSDPQYYFVAKNVQDVRRIPLASIEKTYELAGTVFVNGEPKLWIYQKSPVSPVNYRLGQYASVYDSQVTAPVFRLEPPWDASPHLSIQYPMEVNLDHKVRLLGFDLDREMTEPGGALLLTLYWQAIAEMEVDYHVFVHVEEGSHIWGQKDGVPHCGTDPTYDWEPGELIVDRYSIPINPNTPRGRYPLLVGMYEHTSGQRLQVLNKRGELQGDSVELTTVRVKRE